DPSWHPTTGCRQWRWACRSLAVGAFVKKRVSWYSNVRFNYGIAQRQSQLTRRRPAGLARPATGDTDGNDIDRQGAWPHACPGEESRRAARDGHRARTADRRIDSRVAAVT